MIDPTGKDWSFKFRVGRILKIHFLGIKCSKKIHLTIILSVHPDDGHHLEEDFGFGVGELAAAAVPAGSLQVEAIDVHSLCGGLGDIVLHPLGHLVAQHHAVQGPALVGPSDLLKVQRQIHRLKPLCDIRKPF